jgi:hypothetical protein
MVTGLAFALAAMMLNSIAGLLESDATRYVARGRSLVTQPRYLGGPSSRCATCRSSSCRPFSAGPSR